MGRAASRKTAAANLRKRKGELEPEPSSEEEENPDGEPAGADEDDEAKDSDASDPADGNAANGDGNDAESEDGDQSLGPPVAAPKKKGSKKKKARREESSDDDVSIFSDYSNDEAAAAFADAKERLRHAKRREREVRMGIIDDMAIPVLQFLVRLGFDDMAARRMINVEVFHSVYRLLRLDDDKISNICRVHRKSEGNMMATFISATAEGNLKMAVFCLKHLKNTGRSYALHQVGTDVVESFTPHKVIVDAFVPGELAFPVVTNKILEKDPDHTWEVIMEYLAAVRDTNGIPLAAWARSDAEFWPPRVEDDPASGYLTRDEELIARAPIILDLYRGQTPSAVCARKDYWTPLFAEGNPVLYTELYQILGKLTVWENAKGATRAKDGRKAFMKIYNALFGANVIFHRHEANNQAIASLTYDGHRRNFTFDDYVNRHLVCHNTKATLAEHAQRAGKEIHPFSEHDKVGHLLRGIKAGQLETSQNTILSNDALRNSFDGAVRQFRDFMQSTSNTMGSRENRNISAVGGRGGRGGGRSTDRGGGRGGGGRVGRGGHSKPAPWTQAGVDRCTHLTESRYPQDQYARFSADERQKVFQNRQGRPPNAGPSPPTSVTLSELLSTVSAMRESFEQHRRTNEDTRDRANGRGNGHDDSTGVDPNRNIPRNGGTPGRGTRASGDRE